MDDAKDAEFKIVVDRIKELMTRRDKNKNYQSEYRRFVTYVLENDLKEEGALAFTYIHRGSVDHYFENDLIDRKFQRPGGTRVMSSLQWFYLNLESPGGSFKVSNPFCLEAINKQQDKLKEEPALTHYGCPQKGLKDIMSEGDKKIIIKYILEHRDRDWGSLTTSFCWGNQAAVRGASTRKFGYAEMYMSVGFGPAKEGPRACTLLLVLRTGDMNKDRFTTCRMVGCWRHREVLLCAIGHLCMHVLNTLRLDDEFHVCHYDKTAPAPWWLKQLIDYETLDDETGPMKDVYKATGVEGCKLTHNRTYAVQQAGSEGLAPYQINSLTKHMLEKLHKSYQAEVDKETCKVMAGFSKDEGYFVEREFLELPLPIMELINLLLPRYQTWVRQFESPHGDRTPTCRRFLFQIIPFMVRVVVQDGIYLIRDFPDHVMSNYLKVCNAWNAFLFNSCK
jgi:hypothetical protein